MMRRYSGRVRGFGTPVQISDRPMLGVRYGVHPAYAEKNGHSCLKINVGWRTLSGFCVNTPWGAAWVYLRNWRRKDRITIRDGITYRGGKPFGSTVERASRPKPREA